MYTVSIPKEYILEEDAHYDEYKFRLHIVACLTVTTFSKIYSSGSKLFLSFFKKQQHKEIALDILKYVMDKEEVHSDEIITRRLIRGMYDSGFFG